VYNCPSPVLDLFSSRFRINGGNGMEATRGFGGKWAVLPFSCLWIFGGCHRSASNAPPLVINEVMAGGSSQPLAAPDGSPIVDGDGDTGGSVEGYNTPSLPRCT